MATFEDYPPLVQKCITLEERLQKMEQELENYKAELENYKAELETHKTMHKTQMELLLGFCERDLVTVASEILKWSVCKRREENGEGRQLFDSTVQRMVMLACCAYGEYGPSPTHRDVIAFKNMSQTVIQQQNNTEHFQDLDSLERMVKVCTIAIEQWPSLEEKYEDQVKIVKQYKIFKQLLPKCFHQ